MEKGSGPTFAPTSLLREDLAGLQHWLSQSHFSTLSSLSFLGPVFRAVFQTVNIDQGCYITSKCFMQAAVPTAGEQGREGNRGVHATSQLNFRTFLVSNPCSVFISFSKDCQSCTAHGRKIKDNTSVNPNRILTALSGTPKKLKQ